jgi:signal transduction histidine kinase
MPRNSATLSPGGAFLSTSPADVGSRRLAVAAVLASAVVFFFVAPFATVPLSVVWGFIPAYQSALIVNDLVTAILLFGQFYTLRSRALLALAAGYLFTAFMAAAHALTFPGLFSATGLLGAGDQSTAWIYMFWHAGFPLCVVAYSLLRERPGTASKLRYPAWLLICGTIAAAVAACVFFTWLATAGAGTLPVIMEGSHYIQDMKGVVAFVWLVVAAALALLWLRRPHTVLDNWLLVTLCAWVFDVALSAVMNGGRFDTGFYAGRAYGLLASGFVLAVLLLENGRLYRALLQTLDSERDQGRQLTLANRDLEAFSYSVSHDLRAPLRAIQGYAEEIERSYSSQLPEDGRKDLGRVIGSAQRMQQLIEDLLEFSRLNRQPLAQHHVDLNFQVGQLVAELRAAAPGRSIEFHVRELPDVLGDPALLRQMLINLLSNAVKFTRDRNPAVIEAGMERAAPNGEANGQAWVTCFVRDNGAGFDMKYAHRLFGVFQRLHGQNEFEGTGVGLSIAQRVIERHGGRIWAEGRPNAGATFYFTLPLAKG